MEFLNCFLSKYEWYRSYVGGMWYYIIPRPYPWMEFWTKFPAECDHICKAIKYIQGNQYIWEGNKMEPLDLSKLLEEYSNEIFDIKELMIKNKEKSKDKIIVYKTEVSLSGVIMIFCKFNYRDNENWITVGSIDVGDDLETIYIEDAFNDITNSSVMILNEKTYLKLKKHFNIPIIEFRETRCNGEFGVSKTKYAQNTED